MAHGMDALRRRPACLVLLSDIGCVEAMSPEPLWTAEAYLATGVRRVGSQSFEVELRLLG